MRSKFYRQAENEATRLLSASGCSKPPIPIERVAAHLGLRLDAVELGDPVSGLLVLSGEKATIGYNAEHAAVRQRFTIAHEIGHYVLHRQQQKLFIDRAHIAVFRRDQYASTGESIAEIQANHFAATLLMPEDLVRDEITNLRFDLDDESTLDMLAERFQVSTQAMSLRLSRLELLGSW